MRPLEFIGNTLDCLKQFPRPARRRAGLQLDRVQRGLEPFDWKPITTIGGGVREIRVWDDSGTYRVVYVAKFEEAVYVLHCFRKTTDATSTRDIHLAKQRYRKLLRERK